MVKAIQDREAVPVGLWMRGRLAGRSRGKAQGGKQARRKRGEGKRAVRSENHGDLQPSGVGSGGRVGFPKAVSKPSVLFYSFIVLLNYMYKSISTH
jgi:hypothetical protein